MYIFFALKSCLRSKVKENQYISFVLPFKFKSKGKSKYFICAKILLKLKSEEKSILHYNTRFSWNFIKKSKVATLGFFKKKVKNQVLSSSR